MVETRVIPRPDGASLRGVFTARMGKSDPTHRRGESCAHYASFTPEGPVALAIGMDEVSYRVRGYGAGAAWMVQRAHELLGLHDEDAETWRPEHPGLAKMRKAHGAMRMGRGTSVFDLLCRTIFEQRVTSLEAMTGYTRFAYAHGEPAPGPCEELRLPPRAEVVARLPYYELHAFGLERARAETLIRVARKSAYAEACRDETPAQIETRLGRLRGVGPWTIGTVRMRLGDADAVAVGDYHLPNLVSWSLAKEPRGTDERMLELLAPFAPHRQRVLRLLGAAVRHAPRYGPRARPSRWPRDRRY